MLASVASCDVVTSNRPTTQLPAPTRPVPTLFPTLAAPTPASTPEPQIDSPDTGWLAGSPGVELRRLRVAESPERPAVPMTVVRIDPTSARLRVVYTPEHPLPLRAWFASQRPLAAINGGFFRENFQTAALLVSDGVANGGSYEGFGGMLAVAQDGSLSIRPLRDQAYDPSEPLAQAVQSFPMLVFPGGMAAEPDDDGHRARRSAVAIDRAGRLLLIACPTSDFTLRGLATWLAQSDLEIDRALNLDGGSSTGLFLSDGDLHEELDSFAALPAVLLVEKK
jgi:uncharacterized protein YigE (DUF2233 family)